jgi:glycosyltransferase involved in cell wall biosynthesis
VKERRRLTIFASVDGNHSIDRYAREIAPAFPPEFQVHVVQPKTRVGWRGKLLDKVWRYIEIARAEQGDLNLVVSEAYAFLLRSLPPERTIVVCHDLHPLIEDRHRGSLKSLVRGEMRRMVYVARFRANLGRMQRARRVVAVSEHTRQDLLKYLPSFPPDQVVAVHSGLSANWRRVSDADAAALRAELGLEGKRVLLHVGNDNWYKNFGVLLEAFAKLPEDVVLLKVGAVSAANEQRIGRLGIAKRIVRVHAADDEQLRRLYSAADMLAFPSLHEGFGWPPLEAMACGCPVLATRGGSLGEVCGDAALFVEPKDAQAMAQAMRRLLDDASLRRSLAAKGLEHVKAFRWEKTAARIVELFGTTTAAGKKANG